jgi:acyl carrier protein
MELPAAKRRTQLAARVEERVRGVLGLGSKAAIDAARPLQEYGLDSLLAIELRNALSADLEAKLPQTALFDYPTMGGLTEWLFADVLKAGVDETGQVEEARPEAQIGSGEAVLAGVEELSDEDVERLFELRMAGSKMAGTGR